MLELQTTRAVSLKENVDPIYKDVSRMRTLLIQLKGDQMAPPQVKN